MECVYSYRRACINDLGVIKHINDQYLGILDLKQWESLLYTSLSYVALFQSKIIGCCIANLLTAKTAYIVSLCVHMDHRNRGVGSTLFNFTIDAIKLHRSSPEQILLHTEPKNTIALRMYRQRGFVDIKQEIQGKILLRKGIS